MRQRKRYVEIVDRRMPVGWHRCAWRSMQMRGLCTFEGKTIYHPPLNERGDLFVALHEIGHASLHHQNAMAPHVEEYEAERFAILTMRLEGIPVPKEELASARENVLLKIRDDERRGIWKIDPVIRKWAEPQRRSK